MRINEDYLKQYPLLSVQALEKPVLFVVDMIEGFVNQGALSDRAISSCTPHIIELMDHVKDVYFACDEHHEDAREFQAFPNHCEMRSEEAAIIEALQPYAKNKIGKNSTNTFLATDFQALFPTLLQEHRDFVMTGCCTDICIMQFALSLNAYFNQHNLHGYRVICVIDAIETYDAPWHDASLYNEMALNIMKQSGITIVRGME